jgi:hypothetical protein
MCLPALPAIAIAATVASSAVSAMGSLAAGAQAKAYGDYQANVERQNEKLTADQIKDARDSGRFEELVLGRKQAQLKGTQNASMGANGVDLGFGSPLQVQRDTAMISAEDTGNLYLNQGREEKGYLIDMANHRAEAQAAKMRGSAARTASYFQAGSDILSGVSQFASMSQKFGAAK